MVTFRAIGGLGNQLFVLAAAIAHGEALNRKVRIDLRRSARGKDQGGPHNQSSSLLSFKLNGVPLANYSAGYLPSSFMDHAGSIEKRVFQSMSNSYQSHWCHTSPSAGFDPTVFENSNIKYFRGYFQSYKYLQYIHQSGKLFDLSLISPSSAYLELKNRIGFGPHTVLHIRRGDYVSASSNFGLLDDSYYARGLDLLASQGSLGRVLVFSDDPRVSEDTILRKVFEEHCAEFVETSYLDPAEALMLLSSGSNFVIANSSFSWWGAALSGRANVVYPEPWFRSEPQPEDLNPNSWSPLKSSWLN